LAEDKEEATRISGLSRKWAAIIGLIFILGSEYILRDAFISKTSSGFQIAIAIAVEWVVALFILLFWIPKVEHCRLDSIGFRKFRLRYIWISIVAYIVYVLISAGLEPVLKSAGMQSLRDISPALKDYGFPLLFGLFLTGTFVEEIFYRGYIIERVTELTGRKWVAGIISWLTFTLVHLRFFGVGPTLEIAIIAIIFVILYIKAKSIWPAIIIHGINDIFGFLIGPFIM
jgi:membrane protease YdiL (CAAX protease family)